MEEQAQKTKSGNPKGKGAAIIGGGLIVLAIAIALVTVLALHSNDNSNKSGNSSSATTPVAPKTAVIRVTGTGFEPATLSVQKGTKVMWLNADAGLHQIVANPYPKGTDLPGLKSEILNQAQSYTYTAATVGSFGYHDQMNPTINGTLLVKQ
jgi:plastocyanin